MASGDECRARAKECIEAAERAADPERKLVLLDLAQRWLCHAVQLDAVGDRRELRGDALVGHPHTTH
jgi:hypothetical protein